jgi:hypothetical protein
MSVRVKLKGPLADRAVIERTIRAEFAQATRDAAPTVKTAANRAVHRDQGTYERGWQAPRLTYGARQIVKLVLENRARHAATQEEGRGEDKTPPPVQSIYDWTLRKAITPREGDSEANRLSMAIAMSRVLGDAGWPNAGSRGYLGPPRPVATALDREANAIHAQFERAVSRVARRLG